MGELIVPKPDDHAGSACHPSVDSVMPQKQAECRVVSIGRNASYGVAGVYVLQIDLFPCVSEVRIDPIAQEAPDITETDIS